MTKRDVTRRPHSIEIKRPSTFRCHVKVSAEILGSFKMSSKSLCWKKGLNKDFWQLTFTLPMQRFETIIHSITIDDRVLAIERGQPKFRRQLAIKRLMQYFYYLTSYIRDHCNVTKPEGVWKCKSFRYFSSQLSNSALSYHFIDPFSYSMRFYSSLPIWFGSYTCGLSLLLADSISFQSFTLN